MCQVYIGISILVIPDHMFVVKHYIAVKLLIFVFLVYLIDFVAVKPDNQVLRYSLTCLNTTTTTLYAVNLFSKASFYANSLNVVFQGGSASNRATPSSFKH